MSEIPQPDLISKAYKEAQAEGKGILYICDEEGRSGAYADWAVARGETNSSVLEGGIKALGNKEQQMTIFPHLAQKYKLRIFVGNRSSQLTSMLYALSQMNLIDSGSYELVSIDKVHGETQGKIEKGRAERINPQQLFDDLKSGKAEDN